MMDMSEHGQEPTTLSITEAVPFIVQQQEQQQEEQDDDTRESLGDTAGSYQIVAQQLLSTGQVQLTLSDGVNFLQTTINADQLQGFETGQQSILLQAADVDPGGEISYVAADVPEQTLRRGVTQTEQGQINPTEGNIQELVPGTSEVAMRTSPPSVIQSGTSIADRILQVIDQSAVATHENNTTTTNQLLASGNVGQFFILKDDSSMDQIVMEPQIRNTQDVKHVIVSVTQHSQSSLLGNVSTVVQENVPAANSLPGEVSDLVTSPEPVVSQSIPEKMPDLSKPIEVTDHMEVTVGGKKCLLKVNPDTGQLCAYPLITTSGRRRGRPKKAAGKVEPVEEPEYKPEVDVKPDVKSLPMPDGTNSAAQGLLELSNTGPDGVRRSARNRGKPKTLEEYEVQELSSDDDAAIDGDDEVLPSGAVRRRKSAAQKDYIPPSHIQPSSEKRGRGRPRRYPRAEDTPTSHTIPTVMIPSEDGTTIMMAPIQGITNLEAFQEQVKNMSILQQLGDEEGLQYLNLSGSIIDTSDGNTLNIQLADMADNQSSLQDSLVDDQSVSQDQLADNQSISQDSLADNQFANQSVNLVTDNQDQKDLVKADETECSDTESKPLAEEGEVPEGREVKVEIHKLTSNKSDKLKPLTSVEGQPTIIQIPENLLPMFTQKKDPVRIGLKASDLSLEKMKCPECDFQGYYEQQYQDHIVTHDNAIKCKCCKYATFGKEDLIKHFKKNHPRCICSYCDHMAEHAYIIKRHTMRHTQIGCKCDACGKVYKDSYVLKMHVKMVHMPAEVLFECNVCYKKFTRKAHLKRHLRIHEPEKPYKCPHCQYRGCEKSDIVKHLLVHEDPKHQCPICNKSFRHIKNKELHLKRHSGQRDYKCGVCDFYGYTFTDIRKHIERKHTDCRPFICDKCNMVFTSEAGYKEHKSEHCPVFMIEQALAVATSDGGTTQARIQIPSNFTLDNTYPIQVDPASNKEGSFTVHAVGLQGALTEDEIHVVGEGQINESELQSLVAQSQLTESELQAAVSQGQIIDTVNTIQTIGNMVSTSIQERSNNVRPSIHLYKDGNDDQEVIHDTVQMYNDGEEEEETMGDDGMREEQMEDMMSDGEDKSAMDSDQMLEMVTIIR